MKPYLLLVIVAISISNVSSKRGRCQSCSTSFIKFWKHCKSGLKCSLGECIKYASDFCGKKDQMLASLGNANEEDFPSIDLL